jgi:hypothetical protein
MSFPPLTNRKKFAISVAIFALAGAPIGWIAYWVSSLVMSFSLGGLELYFLLLGIPLSFLMGAIPAVMAGMGFGVIIARKCLSAPLGAAVGLIAGVVSTFVYSYCLGYSIFIPWFGPIPWFEMVGAGGFAGAVCGYLVSWIINRKQPRDLSSAPVAPPVSLHDAVWNGSWGTAKRLSQQGAEVNQANPENPYTTPTAQITDPASENRNNIRKKIRNAWIAAIVFGSLTLLLTLAVMSEITVGIFGFYAFTFLYLAEFLGNYSIYKMFIDIVLFFGLAFGIYKKSRTCATILLVYFTVSQIFLRIETSQTSGIFVSILFIYFFWQGVSGTFAYHKLKNHKQT